MVKSKKSKVFFVSNEIHPNLKDVKNLKAFIALIFKKEKRSLGSITYVFCSDDTILKINKDFLEHNFYTDIITFDLSEKPGPINAEVLISIDRIRDNAQRFKTTYKSEILRVMFHGALHLCGYGDKTDAESRKMRKKEDLYLNMYSQ